MAAMPVFNGCSAWLADPGRERSGLQWREFERMEGGLGANI